MMAWPAGEKRNDPGVSPRRLTRARAAIADAIERGVKGVSYRRLARCLGVDSRTVRRWIAGEDVPPAEAARVLVSWANVLDHPAVLAVLAKLDKQSVSSLAAEAGVSASVIQNWRHDLRLVCRRRRYWREPEWSQDEIALLGSAPDRTVAKWLDRSVQKVMFQRQALGIAPAPPPASIDWPQIDPLLGKMFDVDLAEKFERDPRIINNRRRKLGIAPYTERRQCFACDEWFTAEKRHVITCSPACRRRYYSDLAAQAKARQRRNHYRQRQLKEAEQIMELDQNG